MYRIITLAAAASILLSCTTTQPSAPIASCPELAALSPAARAEVLAIANIVARKPRFALDFTDVGTHALSVGYDTMVTFAVDPAATTEDIIFFIPAKGLIRAGLDVKKYEQVPPPGQMVSGKWYYSSGREPEVRFNKNAIGIPVLMMAVDSDGR